MEGHPGRRTVVVELDVQRCLMGLEGQTRCDPVFSAEGIIDRGVLIPNGDLCAHLDVFVVRNFAHVPSRETSWIAVVAALLVRFCAIEVTVEVHLLTRIVLMDALTRAIEIIDAIFDRVDGTCNGFFGHTNGVAEAPPKE